MRGMGKKMKTIIIYGSTYGYARDCAKKLSEQLKGEVFLVNVSTDIIPKVDEFDNVVIGGSIYMGRIQKKIKAYCDLNLDMLKNKRVGLFLCCGLPDNFEQNMKNSFSEELLSRAIVKECFGGELRTAKMSLAHKIITGLMKKALSKEGKEGKETTKPMLQSIDKLASIINK